MLKIFVNQLKHKLSIANFIIFKKIIKINAYFYNINILLHIVLNKCICATP